jgi:hypothetical protein
MPRTRALLRAVSRDGQRATARPNPARWQTALTAKTTLRGRAERRKHGWRGDISAQLHARRPMRRRPVDVRGLITGKMPTSGQIRIDAKRNDRAQYWAGLATI